MPGKHRQVSAKALAQDIKSGMGLAEISSKHDIPSERIPEIVNKLVALGFIPRTELPQWTAPDGQTTGKVGLWKTVRVFISSTFRDMHAERDHLVKVVFPALRERLEPYRIHLVDIDLRWGVTREQADNDKVLEVCLQRIDECRPFFIGILGQRFGWVPKTPPPLENPEYEWTRKLAGLSITAMEIAHGALRTPANAQHTSFYLRRPDFLRDAGEDVRDEVFLDEHGERLKILKKHIGKFCDRYGVPLREYSCGWGRHAIDSSGDTRGSIVGLEEFGEWVKEDLWRAISTRYPEIEKDPQLTADTEGGLFAEEDSLHELFAELRLRSYVEREGIQDRLAGYLDGSATKPLLLSGMAGSGKSSLLARLWQERLQRNSDGCRLVHFVGASSHSLDIHSLLMRIWAGLSRIVHEEISAPPAPDELPGVVRELVSTVPSPKRVSLVIDGVEHFDDLDAVRNRYWLPESLPSNIKVVLGCAESALLEELRKSDLLEIKVAPLSLRERREILTKIPSLSAKVLDQEQIQSLLGNPATGNPLFLGVCLEELREFGSFDKLNDRIRSFPQAEGPQGLDALFQQVLDRLEQERGAEMVGSALSLLACSRAGLSESELSVITGELLADQGISNIAPELPVLLRRVRPYLAKRGAHVDFANQTFREAVEKRYLIGLGQRRQIRTALANYFKIERPERPGLRPAIFHYPWQFTDPDDCETYNALLLGQESTPLGMMSAGFLQTPEQQREVGTPSGLGLWEKVMLGYREPPKDAPPVCRRVFEYPWQLAAAGEWDLLRAFLSDLVLLRITWKRNRFDVLSLWGQLRRALGIGMDEVYSDVIRDPKSHRDEELGLLASLLRQHGYVDQALALRERLSETPDSLYGRVGVGSGLMNQGVALSAKGESGQAIELYLRAEKIFRDEGDLTSLATCLANRGVALFELRQFEEAGVLYEESERLCRQTGDREQLQCTIGEQALLLMQKGTLDKAMTLLKEKETICREIGHRPGVALALMHQSLVCRQRGKPQEGLPLLDEADGIYRELGDEDGLSKVRHNRTAQAVLSMAGISGIGYQSGDVIEMADFEAIAAATRSFAGISREKLAEEETRLVEDMRDEDQGSTTVRAWDLSAGGDVTEALEFLFQCENESRRGIPQELWRLYRCRAYLLLRQNDLKGAVDLCRKAVDAMDQSGVKADERWTTKDFLHHLRSRL